MTVSIMYTKKNNNLKTSCTLTVENSEVLGEGHFSLQFSGNIFNPLPPPPPLPGKTDDITGLMWRNFNVF